MNQEWMNTLLSNKKFIRYYNDYYITRYHESIDNDLSLIKLEYLERWEEKIKYRFSERDYGIIIDYLCKGRAVSSITKEHGITSSRIYQIINMAIRSATYIIKDGIYCDKFPEKNSKNRMNFNRRHVLPQIKIPNLDENFEACWDHFCEKYLDSQTKRDIANDYFRKELTLWAINKKYNITMYRARNTLETIKQDYERLIGSALLDILKSDETDIDYREFHISVLQLSTKTYNAVSRSGRNKLGDFDNEYIYKIARSRNIGKKSFNELLRKLYDFDFRVEEECEDDELWLHKSTPGFNGMRLSGKIVYKGFK